MAYQIQLNLQTGLIKAKDLAKQMRKIVQDMII